MFVRTRLLEISVRGLSRSTSALPPVRSTLFYASLSIDKLKHSHNPWPTAAPLTLEFELNGAGGQLLCREMRLDQG